jgi:hypothetical protein
MIEITITLHDMNENLRADKAYASSWNVDAGDL